jgi:hypothetical protein
MPFTQPGRHELSGVVRLLPGCLQDPPQPGGGRGLCSNRLTSTPPPARLRLPRGDDTLRSPIHAGSDDRKTRREPRTWRTRFSALHTPRPESGRGRSESVRTEIPPRLRPRAREHRFRKQTLHWMRHGDRLSEWDKQVTACETRPFLIFSPLTRNRGCGVTISLLQCRERPNWLP